MNLSRLVTLCKEELLVEASRPPRSGLLHFILASNQTSIITANQLLSGRSLVYRNQMLDDTQLDEIIFHVYPRSESSKRTSRLRIPLPINLNPPTDPLMKVCITYGFLNNILKVFSFFIQRYSNKLQISYANDRYISELFVVDVHKRK